MASPSYKLKVRVIRAEGLQRMNKFTSDHPYVTCGIKRADGKVVTKADTKPVMSGDKLNPIWDEMLELESWKPGETLEFTVYDRGLLGSKTEGKAELPAESFHPHGFQGMRPINGLPDAKLFVEVQAVGAQDGEPPSEQDPGLPTDGAVEVQAVGAQDGEPPSAQYPELATYVAPEAGANVVVPHRLGISLLQAHGLKHMNNFTGDSPYVTCEVKHHDPAAESTRVETKAVAEGDTLNPFWGETHNLEPWFQGESLEFTVHDKGLVDSKTECKAVLPSDVFFPQGFSGFVAISGQPHALLHVIVRPLGPLVASGETAENPDVDASSKKKKKKLKFGKKHKQCC